MIKANLDKILLAIFIVVILVITIKDGVKLPKRYEIDTIEVKRLDSIAYVLEEEIKKKDSIIIELDSAQKIKFDNVMEALSFQLENEPDTVKTRLIEEAINAVKNE